MWSSVNEVCVCMSLYVWLCVNCDGLRWGQGRRGVLNIFFSFTACPLQHACRSPSLHCHLTTRTSHLHTTTTPSTTTHRMISSLRASASSAPCCRGTSANPTGLWLSSCRRLPPGWHTNARSSCRPSARGGSCNEKPTPRGGAPCSAPPVQIPGWRVMHRVYVCACVHKAQMCLL